MKSNLKYRKRFTKRIYKRWRKKGTAKNLLKTFSDKKRDTIFINCIKIQKREVESTINKKWMNLPTLWWEWYLQTKNKKVFNHIYYLGAMQKEESD